MFKKIVTTVGLVSVFGASTAMGALNLSSATAVTPIDYASETLGVGDVQAGAGPNVGTTFFNINDAGTNIDVSMTTGFVGAVTGSNDYYVKVELTNAVYGQSAEAMTVASSPTNSAASTLFSGGALGTSSAIYQFDISAAITATATLSTSFTKLGTNGNPSVKMSIFETLTEANKADGTAVSTASQQIVKFVAGNITTVTAPVETSQVSADFKKYVNGSSTNLLGEFGSITLSEPTSTFAADNAAIAAAKMYTAATSVVTYTGDFSNGTWYIDLTTCPNKAAIPTLDKLKLNAAKTSGTIALSRVISRTFLCHNADGVAAIKAGSISFGINYTPPANINGPADTTGVVVGTIIENGTTQNINYLTTFSDYNQRVYITNRGTTDATYAFSFQSEAGVTATAGTAATGTSKAGAVLALKAKDIVTLTGKTRTAATLTIVGTPGNFGISTQQVNLSNGATDTVVYRGADRN